MSPFWFQLFFFRGCGLHDHLLPPVSRSHGLLLPGDLVVGIHSFLWHHLHWPSLQALCLSRVWFVILFLTDCSPYGIECVEFAVQIWVWPRQTTGSAVTYYWRAAFCCEISQPFTWPGKLPGLALAFHLSGAWEQGEGRVGPVQVIHHSALQQGPENLPKGQLPVVEWSGAAMLILPVLSVAAFACHRRAE